MNGHWLSIKQQDKKEYSGYMSLPPSGRGPGLILIQEIWGVNAHIQTVADQYALAGYVVLAPDIFWLAVYRIALNYDDTGNQQAFELYKNLDFIDAAHHLSSAMDTLRALPFVDSKVGVVGFCMGGQLAYRISAFGHVDATVCYYGGGIERCLDLSNKITSPILFHYANQDEHISANAVDKVKEAFKHKTNAIFFDYPATQHGFNCWARPKMYQQKAASMALGRTLMFLSEHL